VPRTPEPERKEALLARAVDYVFAEGLEGLSLRPLATALGTSARVLMYHFGSKEELVAEVVTAARGRLIEELPGLAGASLEEAWERISAPHMEPYWRFSGQVLALGLAEESAYSQNLPGIVHDWLAVMPAEPEGLGTLAVAAFRGLMIDLLVTGERERADAAVRLLAGLIPQGGPDASRPA
jgi:AcrR family transcriptional regulator